MLQDDEVLRQQELLKIHRQTLNFYLRQIAKHGSGFITPSVNHGVTEARLQISHIKDYLRAHSIIVEDELQDEDIEDELLEKSLNTPSTSKNTLYSPTPKYTDIAINDARFSPSLTEQSLLLNRKVEELTKEQFRVIQMLSGEHRVRISGCAGSGKTLVAVEKAIRLAKAGLKTLFLCHNPLLAEHIKFLGLGSGIHIEHFIKWIGSIVGYETEYVLGQWNNYEEPDMQTLERAFDIVVDNGPKYDAIIVDEGQDFREEWWYVVEASLKDIKTSIFYIFHDDNQTLLAMRARYPILSPVVDLSRNCRNSGSVYSVMRFMNAELPDMETKLSEEGKTLFYKINPEHERQSMEKVLSYVHRMDYTNVVLLLGGNYSLNNYPLLHESITVETSVGWQEGIRDQFSHVINTYDPHAIVLPEGGRDWLVGQLELLSTASSPSSGDIDLVVHTAKSFKIQPSLRNKIARTRNFPSDIKWHLTDGKLYLGRSKSLHVWPSEILLYLGTEQWTWSLPQPKTVTIKPYYDSINSNSISAYNIGDYKGLEADVIILAINGRTPMIEHQVYVGVSRARFCLICLFDTSASKLLRTLWVSPSD